MGRSGGVEVCWGGSFESERGFLDKRSEEGLRRVLRGKLDTCKTGLVWGRSWRCRGVCLQMDGWMGWSGAALEGGGGGDIPRKAAHAGARGRGYTRGSICLGDLVMD